MSIRFHSGAIMLAVTIIVTGCKREERSLRAIPGLRAYPREAVPPENLKVGGTDPNPPVVESRTLHNPFEGNAYAISEGKQLYTIYNCVGCHMNGGGDIGAPLLNSRYRYGSTTSDIYESIVNGRPNGMPAWGTRIPQYQIWQLVAYVRSLHGSEPVTATPARADTIERTREQTQ